TLSLAIPLGRNLQGFVQHSWLDGKGSAELQLQGSAARNRLDWRVIASGGDDPGDLVDAFARWDGARADVSARIIHADGSTGFQAQLAQSLVAMGGGLHLAGRIDDGFTIAEVGQPRVRVALENRVVGRTGASGRLLLSDLQSYLPNTISIDPLDLPLDASVAATTARVAPRSGAGMVTRFDVRRAHSAIVMVVRSDGTPPPPGAMVRLVGQAFEAPMGYGGEIFVRGLQAGENRLDIAWRDGSCRVRFRAALPEGLPRWGPYRCEP
ncbi:MAG: fimbrial biogenesis outer membrane usher protein, partial [Sphingomonadales bacterium]